MTPCLRTRRKKANLWNADIYLSQIIQHDNYLCNNFIPKYASQMIYKYLKFHNYLFICYMHFIYWTWASPGQIPMGSPRTNHKHKKGEKGFKDNYNLICKQKKLRWHRQVNSKHILEKTYYTNILHTLQRVNGLGVKESYSSPKAQHIFWHYKTDRWMLLKVLTEEKEAKNSFFLGTFSGGKVQYTGKYKELELQCWVPR